MRTTITAFQATHPSLGINLPTALYCYQEYSPSLAAIFVYLFK